MIRRVLIPLLALTLATAARADDEQTTRRLIGALLYSTVDLQLDGAPLRAALTALGQQLDVPLVGRFSDDPVGYGLDADWRIDLHADGIAALDALESILAQCTEQGRTDCTWQLRRGYVEVGTKGRLSVPAARTRRLYDIRDLMIEPADFTKERKFPQTLALDVVQEIVETIEPGTWDWGQIEYGEDEVEGERLARTPDGGAAPADDVDLTKRYVPRARISIIRQWRDVLIVDAPDYVHRQINGYPPPIRPGAGDDAEAPRWLAPGTWRHDPG